MRTTGAPSPNLPNLDAVRGRKEPEPKKHTPIPAKRCRHWDKKCKELKEKKAFNQSVPEDDSLRGRIAMADGSDLTNIFDWRNGLLPPDSPVSAFDGRFGRFNRPAADIPAGRSLRKAPEDGRSTPQMTPDGKRPLPHAFASSLLPAAAFQYDDLNTARVQPHYRTGNRGEDLLSGNFHWSAPIISMPGRAGHDLNLPLNLNSLLWTKAGGVINFDMDHGWPAPGFRFGFPVFYGPYLNSRTNRESFILITPSGGAVELRKMTSGYIFEAEDSTYTQLKYDYVIEKYVVTTADGTQYIYGTTLEIKDRNGNLITVTYNTNGLIDTITDTLSSTGTQGRVLYFSYNYYDDLRDINQYWNGVLRTIASFSYADLNIYYNFSGATPDNISYGQTVSVLSEVYLLGGTIYKFQYNTYGQVTKVERYGDTLLRAWTSYNLPQNQSSGAQTDCPRFTTRTDWAYEWSAPGGVTTNYQFFQSATNPDVATEPSIPTLLYGQAATPDGTAYKEFHYPDPAGSSKWRYGLMKMSETWTEGNTRIKKRAKMQYQQPCGEGSVNNWLYQCNPRVTESNIYDNTDTNNNTWENQRRTTITYAPPYQGTFDFNLPGDVYEYDSNATTVLRRTHTDYNQSSTYVDRRIIGLPSMRMLYDGAGALASKVEYIYDEAGSVQAHSAAPIRHNTANYGTSFVAGRGNLTTMRRYNVNDGSYVQSKTNYYLTGTVANTSELHAPGEQNVAFTIFNYNGAFYNSTVANTFAFPTTVTDRDGFSSTIQYDYNNSAVARLTDPKGASVLRQYDVFNRLFRVTNEVNGAYTRHEFAPNQYYVQSYTTIQEGQGEFYSISIFDGHGRVRTVVSEHPGSAGAYKAVYNVYDTMGRPWQQSNPTEINGYWQPSGDDSAWWWSVQGYDWNSRPAITTNTDGTTKSISYDGCGCAGSNAMTITDEGTVITVGGQPQTKKRQQKVFHDVLGRVVKTQALNWENGTPHSTTINTYNVRDQITSVKEYSGDATGAEACPSSACQKTDMTYDGHGRLWKQRRPIETSDNVYLYNNDDTLWKMTDPRGINSIYSYNNRGLVTGISYDTLPNAVLPSPLPSRPIPSSSVTFGYDEAGNRVPSVGRRDFENLAHIGGKKSSQLEAGCGNGWPK